MSSPQTPLLNQVTSPAALREFSIDQLEQYCIELREFLIHSVSKTGGHLAASLGTVELAVALHYVYDTPHDRLVWDIGHQGYPHKIITGRRNEMHTLRQQGGLAGFLRREESEYDCFGAGHSSTSISAALGMAISTSGEDPERAVTAIIGDGALGAGMAFEALNHTGALDANLLVILNDNDMSISRNVGALSNYLSRVLSGRAYTSAREGSKTVLGTIPPAKRFARRWEEHMKGMVMPSTLFEELGFYYIGPVEGHNLKVLIKTLRNMKSLTGPRFLHVVTQKGKGYEPAEDNPCFFHGVSAFDKLTGKPMSTSQGVSYTKIFSNWLCDTASNDEQLVAITPAMCEGSGLVEFSKEYPDRYFDVGIAEQHALTLAAGLACENKKPVVAIYSTFLQRAYDQLVHDICIQNLDVTFAIDRAGLVGPDGETHSGIFDLSFLSCLPNMMIAAPSSADESRALLTTAYQYPGPAAVRYPRDVSMTAEHQGPLTSLPVGKANQVRDGKGIAILSFGTILTNALQAADRIDATVVDMRFIKPLDEQLIIALAHSHDALVTIEENVLLGGVGSAVCQTLQAMAITTPVLNLGLSDRFPEQASRNQQLEAYGLHPAGIEQAITGWAQNLNLGSLDGILGTA